MPWRRGHWPSSAGSRRIWKLLLPFSADAAISNPNAIEAQNLVRLALYCGQDAWRRQADKLFDGLLPLANENLFMHVGLLNALDFRLRAAEIVVVGKGDGADALVTAALSTARAAPCWISGASVATRWLPSMAR